MKYGFIGSGDYKNKKFVISILEQKINKEIDIIVSGHSPRNKYDNVDIWSERWAYDNCKIEPIIHCPNIFNENGFFNRNKLIAKDSEELHCFINKGKYRSGTWNTIKHFGEYMIKDAMNNVFKRKLFIYDETGKLWENLKSITLKLHKIKNMNKNTMF